jgi:hypothetical protein
VCVCVCLWGGVWASKTTMPNNHIASPTCACLQEGGMDTDDDTMEGVFGEPGTKIKKKRKVCYSHY